MRHSIATLTILGLLFACGETGADEEAAPADTAALTDTTAAAADSATARVMGADGRTLGVISLVEIDGAVSLSGTLTGLTPGDHGFHIHETGTCETPSFASAGGHFAPAGSPHGFDAEGGPHAGDLRNLSADADSVAIVDQTNERVTLTDGESALLDADGSALIVHAGADDYASQPSGDAGDPIACGVIEG